MLARMRNWWHRLWCRDCRELGPTHVVVMPNPLPLQEMFRGGIRSDPYPPSWFSCPIAKAKSQAQFDRAFVDWAEPYSKW